MGSSGSGNFSDYSGNKPTDAGKGDSIAGGASGVDKCQQAFSSILEDVAQCAYFANTKAVPAAGVHLGIVLGKRIFAVDSGGTIVGALPTSFNYLAGCLASGVTYVGVVKSSAVSPVPTVEADFVPQ